MLCFYKNSFMKMPPDADGNSTRRCIMQFCLDYIFPAYNADEVNIYCLIK